MNYLQLIRIALGLLPEVIDTVKAVEAAVPQSGAGVQKLEAVKNIVQSVYDTGTSTEVAFETLWPVLSGMVKAVVNLLNSTGIFTKSVSAPA